LPAAVIWPVKKRPKWWAASITALRQQHTAAQTVECECCCCCCRATECEHCCRTANGCSRSRPQLLQPSKPGQLLHVMNMLLAKDATKASYTCNNTYMLVATERKQHQGITGQPCSYPGSPVSCNVGHGAQGVKGLGPAEGTGDAVHACRQQGSSSSNTPGICSSVQC
jgi:hypothetical protein